MRLASVVMLLLPSVLPAARIFNVVDLGTPGGWAGTAYRLNSAGQYAGWNYSARYGYQAASDAGPVPGRDGSAHGINDLGSVAGTSWVGGSSRATVWSGGAATAVAGPGSSALDVNNAGQVVGSAAGRAFVYDGALQYIGGLGGWSAAYAISETGLVAGYSELRWGVFHAFLWDPTEGGRDLGTLGGRSSYAMDVNDGGEVAGSSLLPSGAAHAFLYSGGTMRDLGALGSSSSYAYGLNSRGQVVGYSGGHAFLWEDGEMFDLNDLLLPGSGWELSQAFGVNDSGQIVGSGLYGGQVRAFRLDPVMPAMSAMAGLQEAPEPGSWALFLIGLLLCAAGIRRR